MKIFIAAKYDPLDLKRISELREAVVSVGATPYAFADEGYIANEKEMMEKSFAKLQESDVLLVEGTKESFGVGIEAGFFAKGGKPIISVFKMGVKISRTIKGISSVCIEYENTADLEMKLKGALSDLRKACKKRGYSI